MSKFITKITPEPTSIFQRKAWLTTIVFFALLTFYFACSINIVQAQTATPQTTSTSHATALAVITQTNPNDVIITDEICSKEQADVTFKPHTIFDESEEGIIFLHRWANAIHIDTKVMTLEDEAAFFLNKCNKTFADMAELERHLRSRKYIRDAKVTSDKNGENITVTTWDNWSLMPTISFGRKGGVNTYSFGIKERNLLGLGIDAEIESYKNAQRKGYKVVSTIPLFQKQNTAIKLRFSDNDDGKQKSLFLQKSFAAFHIPFAYNVGFNDDSRDDTIFQNGSERSIFSHEINYKTLSYAWMNFNTPESLLRYRVGVTQDQHEFSDAKLLSNQDIPVQSTQQPQDREFLYPWFGVEYIEKDFRKLTNVHLISQIEDFNHGWQFDAQLGLGNGNKENSAWSLWKMQIKKGFHINTKSLFLLNLAFAGDIYKDKNNRILASINSEYFYRFNNRWGFYVNNTNFVSDNQYQDRPVTMGGNTGLRGFPLQYQHGKNSIKLTSELRYYPDINLFKLFDLAGVAFFDTGRAFGGSPVENIEKNWLSSAGLGLRVYSPHSGGSHQVIHVDFAFPQSKNPDINSFEIRVQAKKSF